MYDGIKLFLEWVGYFFIAYLIGYSTFLFLSVVVGSLELYKHRRQEMFKAFCPRITTCPSVSSFPPTMRRSPWQTPCARC